MGKPWKLRIDKNGVTTGPWPPSRQQQIRSLANAATAFKLYHTADGATLDWLLGELLHRRLF